MKYDTLNAVVDMYQDIIEYLKNNKKKIIEQHSEATFNSIWMDTANSSNYVLAHVD